MIIEGLFMIGAKYGYVWSSIFFIRKLIYLISRAGHNVLDSSVEILR